MRCGLRWCRCGPRSPRSRRAAGRGWRTGMPCAGSCSFCARVCRGNRRSAQRNAAARGVRLLGHDLLAAAAGLASGRGVGPAAPRPARTARSSRRARLVSRFAGRRIHRSKKGGDETGPNPTDRGRAGTKRHCVTDRRGTPLGLTLTGANRHDSMALAATLDAVPGVRSGRRGRPRKRPEKLHASFGTSLRDTLSGSGQGLRPSPVPPGMPGPLHHSPHRAPWRRDVRQDRPTPMGGRTDLRPGIARFRRLATRYDRRADIHIALTKLATAIICMNQIKRFC